MTLLLRIIEYVTNKRDRTYRELVDHTIVYRELSTRARNLSIAARELSSEARELSTVALELSSEARELSTAAREQRSVARKDLSMIITK